MEIINEFRKRIQFEELIEIFLEMTDKERGSDEGISLLADAIAVAPQDIKKMIADKLRELDLLPKAEFVDDDGNIFFSAEAIAEKLGVPIEEVEAECQGNAKWFPSPDGDINRLH